MGNCVGGRPGPGQATVRLDPDPGYPGDDRTTEGSLEDETVLDGTFGGGECLEEGSAGGGGIGDEGGGNAGVGEGGGEGSCNGGGDCG